MKYRPSIALVLLSVLTSPLLKAAPGDLDKSFGRSGTVQTDIGGLDEGNSVAVQADGKILVAGYTLNVSGNDFALVRYTSTGALDTSFNGTGKVTTDIGGGNDGGYSVALQADGKIVVAGYSSNGSDTDFALVRYTSAGALDTSFNGTGKVTTDFGGNDQGYGVVVQADGRIVVAGSSSNGIASDFALARYTSTGALDTSFNCTGKVTTDFGASNDVAFSLAIQADGKIVVAGHSDGPMLVRYTCAGTLDTSFNGTGKVVTDFGGAYDEATSVAVQADGKIVVGGSSDDNNSLSLALARYTSTGELDTSFNSTGKVLTDVSAHIVPGISITMQADGKIVVATTLIGGLPSDQYLGHYIGLVRYTSTGALDSSFNETGILKIRSWSYLDDLSRAVAIQPDGKIVVAGYSSKIFDGDGSDFTLARCTSSGEIDTTIIGSGKVLSVGDGNAYGRSVAVQPDGRIVVAGVSKSESGDFDFVLVRYTSAGALDTGFNGTGQVTTDFGGDEEGFSVAVQEDGKIVVAGYSANDLGNLDFAVARYTSAGVLDTSFNGTGKVTTDFGGLDLGYSMAIQADGKIVVAGYSSNGSDSEFALVRYTSAGALDTSFNVTGKVTTGFGGYDEGHSVAVQADGMIVVAGVAWNGSASDFALARYTSTGALDTSFNSTGKVTTDFGGDDDGRSVAVQADGGIVVAGFSAKASGDDFALARYTNTGGLDTSFNGTGKVTTDFGGTNDAAHSMAVETDGKILAVGTSGGGFRIALVRYTSAGELDTSFNRTGRVATSVFLDDGSIQEAYAVAVQADGKIVVAGHVNYRDIGLLRYEGGGASAAEIAIEQPVGVELIDNVSTIDFGPSPLGVATAAKVFTVRNTGTTLLGNLAITTNNTAFERDLTGFPASLAPDASATFTIAFQPTASGPQTGTLSILSNDSDENPFEVALAGRGLSSSTDTDGDGLSDAAEYQMAALGFNWETAQPTLVQALYENANFADLYTPSQVQALHVGTPLIKRDPATGKFTLTLRLRKSTNLSGQSWQAFPFTEALFLNGLGELEFEFSVPDNAAFFQLEAK